MVGGSYQFGKEQIAIFLANRIPVCAKILDVGAGGGTYGYYLQKYKYKIDAVEVWDDSIKQLHESGWYRNIYKEDIRNFKYKEKYDLIIFGDILEHLSIEDAKKVLAKAEKHCNAILVAVPYLYKQDAFYGNEAEVHLQPDLTNEIFNERYPGYSLIIGNEQYGYYFKNMKRDKNMATKICVYAICKNEMEWVDRWLDNMSEADQIVVLDTGSTDGTFEKLKADPRVTRVEQEVIKPWRFDVARNKSMELVPDDADVLVCTDFDEMFDKGWADVIRKYWDPTRFNRFYYSYAWSHNDVGEPTDIFKYDKIHTKDFKWIFPVHEVLWHKDVPTDYFELDDPRIKFFDAKNAIFLHHYQDKSKERKYYFDLLKLAVEENPHNPHEHMMLAREYLLAHDYKQSVEEYKAVLNMDNIDKPAMRLVLLESLGRCGDCYRLLGNYDEAIWYYQEFIKEDHTYREPYIGLARIYITMKMPTLAKAVLETAIKYSTRKYTWVEQADSWISECNHLLALACFDLKEYSEAISNADIVLQHHPDDVTMLKVQAHSSKALLVAIEKQKTNG